MSGEMTSSKLIVAFSYTCVLFLDRLDITIVNVAVPTFSQIFGVKISSTDWLVTSFLLALACSIPLSTWGAKKFGSKNIFSFSIILFTFSSALCSLSWNLNSLIFFRALQGIGGGLLLPTGMAITYKIFSRSEYPKVANYTLMPTLIAPAIAPTIGGFILEKYSWHWLFLINLPIGICAFIAVTYFLNLGKEELEENPKFDWQGFFIAAVCVSGLLLTLSFIGQEGFINTKVFILILITLVSGAFFISHQKTCSYPIINLNYFKIPLFLQANILQFALQVSYFGSLYAIALYLQVCLGMSPINAGLCMFTQPVATIVMLPFSAIFYKKFGPKYFIFLGFIGIVATSLSLLFIQHASEVLLASMILFLRGLFIGLVNGPVQATSMLDIPQNATGQAAAIFSIFRQISISVGVSVSALILAQGLKNIELITSMSTANPQAKSTFILLFCVISLISCLGILTAFFMNNKQIRSKLI